MSTLPHPDQRYVQYLLHNDSKGIQEIYQRFSKLIIALVRNNSGTMNEAKDLFQEGLMAIYHNAQNDDFVLTASFGSYLYSICQRKWLNVLKRKKIEGVTLQQLDVFEHEQNIEQLTISLQRKEEQRQLLWKQFDALSTRCKELLRMRWEGHEWKEVAQYYELSEGYTRKKGAECWQRLMALIQKDAAYTGLKA